MSRGVSTATLSRSGDGALPFATAGDFCLQVVNRHRFREHVLPWGVVSLGKVYTYTSLRDAVYT